MDAVGFRRCFEVRLASELLCFASCQSVALWILFRMSIMHCTSMHRACLLYYWLLWYHVTHKMTYAVTEHQLQLVFKLSFKKGLWNAPWISKRAVNTPSTSTGATEEPSRGGLVSFSKPCPSRKLDFEIIFLVHLLYRRGLVYRPVWILIRDLKAFWKYPDLVRS